jgi:hypothetical protein
VAENFFLTMTEQPTLMAAPTAIHIDEEWYIGNGLKQTRVIRRAIFQTILRLRKPFARSQRFS